MNISWTSCVSSSKKFFTQVESRVKHEENMKCSKQILSCQKLNSLFSQFVVDYIE